MNRDHSVIFEMASNYCISESFVDYYGYSISSKGVLPTVVDIYKTFHPNAAEHTLISHACETFSRIDHMLDHKTSLNKFEKAESC